MALQYSMYGGKPGTTYRLVAHYDSIKEMVDAFQKGGSYNTVNYGEYVIIDTIVNKNHYNSPQNGIIYRRGLNYLEPFNPNNLNVNSDYSIEKNDKDSSGVERYYDITTDKDGNTNKVFNANKFRLAFNEFVTNPGGGAEYVGQIVGPQGAATELSVVDWKTFLKEYEAGDGKKASSDIKPIAAATFDENGNVKESEIVDVIKYGYVNVKDKDGNITGVTISVDIPSNVFKYHAESIEPYDSGYATYDETEKVWKYTNLIKEDDISKAHPYYWQYDVKVPKGVRGQDLEKFGLELTGKTLNDGNDVDQSDHNYQYYYVTRNYEKSAEGETTKTYIDGYNRAIHKITDNGRGLNVLNKVTRNTTYGVGQRVTADGLGNGLCLQCTQSGITASAELTGLESKTIASGYNTILDGTVIWQVVDDEIVTPNLITVHFTHGDNETVAIRVVDDIIYDENTGRFYVKYSDGAAQVYLGTAPGILRIDYVDTPWVDSNGKSHVVDKIRIVYNTFKHDNQGNVVIDKDFSINASGQEIYPTTDDEGRDIQWIDEQFKFVDRIECDPDTKIATAYYNDGTSTELALMRTIESVEITNEGRLDSNKYLKVNYNNKVNGVKQSDTFNKLPLNDIASIQLYGDNIIVLYSDPDVRKKLYKAGSDYALKNTLYDIPEYTNTTGNDDGEGNLYWINLGAAYQSNHVFSSFDSLKQLQIEYPYGFDKDTTGKEVPQMADRAGWLATIKDASDQITTYAYDYRKNTWYELQNLEAKSISPNWTLLVSQPKEGSNAVPPDKQNNNLNVDGYWFIISTRED